MKSNFQRNVSREELDVAEIRRLAKNGHGKVEIANHLGVKLIEVKKMTQKK